MAEATTFKVTRVGNGFIIQPDGWDKSFATVVEDRKDFEKLTTILEDVMDNEVRPTAHNQAAGRPFQSEQLNALNKSALQQYQKQTEAEKMKLQDAPPHVKNYVGGIG